MFEPKIPAIAATIGFLLSFLIALASGVAFPAVIFRSALMALLSGALAFGIRYIALSFLAVPDAGETAGEEDQSMGSVVDISLGDSADDGILEGAQDLPDFLSDSSDQANDGPGSEIAGEFVPTYPVNAHAATGEKHDYESSAGNRKTGGGLDILPDMEDFVPVGHKDQGGEEDTPGEWDTGIPGSSRDVSAATSAETDTMAKAIRTILARDP